MVGKTGNSVFREGRVRETAAASTVRPAVSIVHWRRKRANLVLKHPRVPKRWEVEPASHDIGSCREKNTAADFNVAFVQSSAQLWAHSKWLSRFNPFRLRD